MSGSSARRRFMKRIAALSMAAFGSCRTHSPISSADPAPLPTARFVVVGEQGAVVARGSAAPPANVSRCALSARFEGMVLQRPGVLEVTMPVAWIAVTRNNDKQWDDFHLRVDAGGSPAGPGRMPRSRSRSETLALTGTVDTATALLTTWQDRDTLRVSLPWTDSLGPRRLFMFVAYHAFGETGARSACDAIFGSDTLVYPLRRSQR